MHSTLNSTRLALRAGIRPALQLRPPTLHNPALRRSFSASSAAGAVNGAGAGAGGNAVGAAQMAMAALTSELDRLAPRFEVRKGEVKVLRDPKEFFETLKKGIRGARRRVFLATLYIGKEEDELIEVLAESLRRNPELKVEVLTDALRGTRETPNKCTASVLATLAKEFPDRVDIRMYHTPNLNGVKKKVIPPRFNEGWGLQHMKLYGFDDEVILSGANLSSDYFTNRQDRYHLYTSPEITEYYHSIHRAVSSLSFKVTPKNTPAGYTLTWPGSNPGPSPLHSPQKFKQAVTLALAPLLRPTESPKAVENLDGKTYLYPLGQFTPISHPFDISTEHAGLSLVLKSLHNPAMSGSSWVFTAGYFNIHPSLKALLLESDQSRGTVITAAPEANGFYGSKGVSGHLPAGYTLLSKRFLAAVEERGLKENLQLKEWRRGTVGEPDGWTYHAKGVWLTLPAPPTTSSPSPSEKNSEPGPSITLIGSSNFTKRSYSLDIEMNALLVTGEEEVQKELKKEVENLEVYTETKTVKDLESEERRAGLVTRVLLWFAEKRM